MRTGIIDYIDLRAGTIFLSTLEILNSEEEEHETRNTFIWRCNNFRHKVTNSGIEVSRIEWPKYLTGSLIYQLQILIQHRQWWRVNTRNELVFPKCCICNRMDDTIAHIANECPTLASNQRKLWRHDQAAKMLHWELCENVWARWERQDVEGLVRKEKVFRQSFQLCPIVMCGWLGAVARLKEQIVERSIAQTEVTYIRCRHQSENLSWMAFAPLTTSS